MPDQNLQAGMVNNSYGQQEPAPSPRHYSGDPERLAPTGRQENTIRAIAIRQLSHGYIVDVGCQTFAIESASALIAKLSEYILNPNATEAKHNEGKLF